MKFLSPVCSVYHFWILGAQGLSGRVLDLRLRGVLQVQASPEALHCVLEQDTLSFA